MVMGADGQVMIRHLELAHWPEVRAIYASGIATGNATFETEPPEWEVWDTAHLPDLRLVCIRGAEVVGWAAASPISDRCCYAGVVENSVYVGPADRGKGVGKLLLDALIEASERAGNWTIQTGIFPENTASVALHGACGFRAVGRRERLGKLGVVWKDVPASQTHCVFGGGWGGTRVAA
jgi:phosphinothricin acetyltransferase